ncbi:hypothetical protein ACFQHW_04595 [Lapidilactobacillus achengensis]|uniref:Uncharacterized protein n=1 Tax=Lapidilactobacillus achengensis TaxID=2486000 RepID=A0ABW1ULM1_9LACO|nr:hypothetical protein [Lapidilactobacillus achengensis]
MIEVTAPTTNTVLYAVALFVFAKMLSDNANVKMLLPSSANKTEPINQILFLPIMFLPVPLQERSCDAYSTLPWRFDG